jgi:hypothetical protein
LSDRTEGAWAELAEGFA